MKPEKSEECKECNSTIRVALDEQQKYDQFKKEHAQ
jgi:hypothetical protein